MRTIFLLTCAILSSLGQPLWALNKEAFTDHLRKAFNIDPQMNITIGDMSPSQFPGLSSFTVTIDQYKQSVFLSQDERYYLWGNAFDLTIDPDQDRASKISTKGIPMKGPKTAPVTVIVYSDIQCPNCQKAHEMIDARLLKEYPTQVRLGFKQFPLSMHNWAEAASAAVICAGDQNDGAFWKMADELYKSAPQISTGTVRSKSMEIAAKIPLNKEKFKTCLDNPDTMQKIREQKNEGTAIGVNATPSFFVNGRLVRGANFEALKAVIEEKLKANPK